MWAGQVLATGEQNKELIRVDPLQRLHTLTNLAQLLAGGPPPGVPRTLRDGSLAADAEAIRQVCSTVPALLASATAFSC